MSEPNQPETQARPILHVVFVVDGSGSMSGERIASLNWAARAAVPALRDAATEHPEVDVRVRVIRFGDGAEWVVAEPTPVAGFTWTALSAGGESDMGAAFAAIASAFSAEPVAGRLPPVVILLSDGLPTDDALAGLAALLATPLGAEALRIPIAIGHDADLDLLRAFSGDPPLRPLRANNAEMLVSHLRWAATTPVVAAATSPDPARTAAASEPDDGAAESGLVW